MKKEVIEMLVEEKDLGVYDKTVRESYKTVEDRLDAGTGSSIPKTNYKVVDLLKGESKRRWQKKFGNC